MTTADAPDWSGSLFLPPLLLGTLVMPHGLATVSGTFSTPAGCTGVVVLGGSSSLITPNREDITVVDAVTGRGGVTATGAWQTPPVCYAGALAVADNSVKVTATWDAINPSVPSTTATIYAVFSSEVQQAQALPDNPVAVSRGWGSNRVIDPTQIVNFSTGTTGDQLVATFLPQGSGPRYVRTASMEVGSLATVPTSGWSLYVKGTTTATVITLVEGITAAGIAGYVNRVLDLEDHTLDLALALPSDPTVQLRLANPANTVAACTVVATL